MNHLERKTRFLVNQPHRSITKSFKTDEQSVNPAIKYLLFVGALLCVCFSTSNAQARARNHAAPPTLQRGGAIVSALAAKVREISSSCGSSVVSGVRHTHIANTRTMSLHASGQAVDMKGNPRCIYQHLSGWPGGYSTDYGRVQHVHISYSVGGHEWGLRFAHGGHHRRGYAQHHSHRRYASR
jgi:hypothetical protein